MLHAWCTALTQVRLILLNHFVLSEFSDRLAGSALWQQQLKSSFGHYVYF